MPIVELSMLPRLSGSVRAWDFAASAKGDFTEGLKLARVADRKLPFCVGHC
jgi:hypothetical protein